MKCNGFLGGSKLYYLPERKAYDKLGEPGISSIVQSTISIHSMLMLGGSGGMPLPGKLWKIYAVRLNLRAFQIQNIYIMCPYTVTSFR